MFIEIWFLDLNPLISLKETGNPTPDQSKSASNLLCLDILLGLLPISSHLEAAITAHLKHSQSAFFGFIIAFFLANQSGNRR